MKITRIILFISYILFLETIKEIKNIKITKIILFIFQTTLFITVFILGMALILISGYYFIENILNKIT